MLCMCTDEANFNKTRNAALNSNSKTRTRVEVEYELEEEGEEEQRETVSASHSGKRRGGKAQSTDFWTTSTM